MTAITESALEALRNAYDEFEQSIGELPDSLSESVLKACSEVEGIKTDMAEIGEHVAKNVPTIAIERTESSKNLNAAIETIEESLKKIAQLREQSPILKAQAANLELTEYLARSMNGITARADAFNKRVSGLPEWLASVGDELEANGEEAISQVEEVLASTVEDIQDGLESSVDLVVDEIQEALEIVESADERVMEAIDEAIREQLTSILEDMGVTQAMSQSLTSITPQLGAWKQTASTVREILEMAS
ncbi:MAG: hypothetical protein AAF483_13840 [Planctomycetota bacterium]